MCTGNSMWASIWSTAISKIWCSNIHCYCLSYFSLSSSDSFVGLLGEDTHFSWPRSFDFTRSWKICFVHDPCSLCLCNTSGLGSILSDAKFDQSPLPKLPNPHLKTSSQQKATWKQRVMEELMKRGLVKLCIRKYRTKA